VSHVVIPLSKFILMGCQCFEAEYARRSAFVIRKPDKCRAAFGYSEYRGKQKAIVEAAVSGNWNGFVSS
jgi:hypothetical protein